MKLLPHHRITIHVPLPVEKARELLAQHVEHPKRFRMSRPQSPFEGQVDEFTFRIMRILLHYQNCFAPVLRGRLDSKGDQSEVHVRFALHRIVAVFLGLWFGFLAFFTVSATIMQAHPLFLLACAGFWLFGGGLTLGSFWFEVRRAERLLLEVFPGAVRL